MYHRHSFGLNPEDMPSGGAPPLYPSGGGVLHPFSVPIPGLNVPDRLPGINAPATSPGTTVPGYIEQPGSGAQPPASPPGNGAPSGNGTAPNGNGTAPNGNGVPNGAPTWQGDFTAALRENATKVAIAGALVLGTGVVIGYFVGKGAK